MGLTGTESSLAYVRELFAFHQWRRIELERVVKAMERSHWDEQLEGSFGSLNKLLNHLAWAELVWFSRTQGQPMPARLELKGEAIFETWQQVTQQWVNLLATSEPEYLETAFEFANSSGSRYRMTLMEIAVHLVDHATYHVGQVMAGVRSLGGAPVSTNYIHYLRAQQKEQ